MVLFFIQSAGLAYHHAPACIYLQLDDIPQQVADDIQGFALKECSETEGWLKLLFNTNAINEEAFKTYRNLCGRIRRMLIASCKTLKEESK